MFPEDSDIPKDALNARIDETFVPRAKVKLPEKGKFEEWKKAMVEKLHAQALRNLPNSVPVAQKTEINIISLISPEPLIQNYTGGGEIDGAKQKSNTAVLMVLDDADSKRIENSDGLLRAAMGNATVRYLLYPRGTDGLGAFTLGWTAKSPPNYVERSHTLLGRTVDEGRVRDIAAAVKFWDKFRAESLNEKRIWTVSGIGRNGILAAYAALFEPTIKEVVIIDPPKSHMDGPYFLNVLRVLDIPEALGLLAPTPLTLINAKDAAFDRTAEIYKLAGAADKLTRK